MVNNRLLFWGNFRKSEAFFLSEVLDVSLTFGTLTDLTVNAGPLALSLPQLCDYNTIHENNATNFSWNKCYVLNLYLSSHVMYTLLSSTKDTHERL